MALRIAILGTGAIGGWLAAQLGAAGHEVSALARGAALEAIGRSGIRLNDGAGVETVPIRVTDRAEEIGPQDVVFLTAKAHALPAMAGSVPAMLGAETMVVPLANGVPWWFLGENAAIAALDPEGQLARAVPTARIVGGVVHASAQQTAPGEVTLKLADRLILGEPGGGISARVEQLCQALRAARIPAVESADIRRDIWFKLWGNMTINPISALTLATADRILDDELVARLIGGVMEEAREIGGRIGCPIIDSAADRNAVTRRLGAFRTSMLQDVEAGRPIELDALLGAPREIAANLGIATPMLDALLGLTRLMGRSRGIYALSLRA